MHYTYQLAILQTCLKDIKNLTNFSLLNSDKTEVIVLGPEDIRDILSNSMFNLDDIALASRITVSYTNKISFDLTCLWTGMNMGNNWSWVQILCVWDL